jgi:hypothetical protein
MEGLNGAERQLAVVVEAVAAVVPEAEVELVEAESVVVAEAAELSFAAPFAGVGQPEAAVVAAVPADME